MNVIGVVGEFNPLHLGHAAHFAKSRELLGQDAPIVCVMSGDFVQRGGPAAFNKHVRAETVLRAGADLVFELPLPWCMASAERFALGAVGLLDGLGAVTHLSFGSEAGDLAPLRVLAAAASTPETIEKIKEQMTEGMSFAAAREMVLEKTLGPEARLLRTANNILGVEYLKALAAVRSSMEPVTTLRQETRHGEMTAGPGRSAGQLRAMLEAGEDIAPFVSGETYKLLARERAAGRGPVTPERMEAAVMSRLRMLSPEDLGALPDATEGLDNRLYKAIRDQGTLMGVLAAVKTKRYPLSRLRRLVFSAALGIRADTGGGTPPYARLLAFSQRGRALLRTMEDGGKLPIVNKPAAVKSLTGPAAEIFGLTAAARDFYVLGYEAAEERKGGSDWRAGPITV